MGMNVEEEDDDDGPPPGFYNSISQKIELKSLEEDDDDGPPPGFQLKNDKKIESFVVEEDDDDDDGPPPGFQSISHFNDVSMCDSHSVFEKNPNSNIELKLVDVKEKDKEKFGEFGLKLGSIEDSQLGLGLKSEEKISEEKNELKIGSQKLHMIEGEEGDVACETGFRSISLKVGEEGKVCDGTFRPLNESHGTASESVHVIEEEKAGGELDDGSQSVLMKVDEKEKDGFELGSQSYPMIEYKNENNKREAGSQSSSQKASEEEKIDDDGPPPGWGSFLPPRSSIESLAAPHQPPSAVSPEIAHAKEVKVRQDLKVGSQSDPMKEDKKERDGCKLESPSFPVKAEEKGSRPVKADEEEYDDEGPPPGWDSFPPPRRPNNASSPPQLSPLTPPPTHSQPSTSSGKAQMVCGSCRTLLSYTKGARFVQCSPCQTVNLVLEEYQVGQVKCRGCTVLLMYPYGAPSVQCSSCLFVTKVGVQNKRPPLSLQQGQRQLSPNQVH